MRRIIWTLSTLRLAFSIPCFSHNWWNSYHWLYFRKHSSLLLARLILRYIFLKQRTKLIKKIFLACSVLKKWKWPDLFDCFPFWVVLFPVLEVLALCLLSAFVYVYFFCVCCLLWLLVFYYSIVSIYIIFFLIEFYYSHLLIWIFLDWGLRYFFCFL